MTENDLIADPSISYWLKEQLKNSAERDLLDAINDAEMLLSVLAGKYRERFGVELYAGGRFDIIDLKRDSHN